MERSNIPPLWPAMAGREGPNHGEALDLTLSGQGLYSQVDDPGATRVLRLTEALLQP